MAYPQSLSGLSTREQIADLVVRACLGIDSNDKALFESAWAADPEIALGLSGNMMTGMEAINRDGFDRVGPLDTHHLISSIRIDVTDGADTAHMTANAFSQHFRAGEGRQYDSEHLLGGATYDIQVVKESDGQWKIKTWIVNVIWNQGTRGVMQHA
jgi:hypothetical protein